MGIPQPLGEPTAALWSDQGKEMNKMLGNGDVLHPDHRVTHKSETSVPAAAGSGRQPEKAGANVTREESRRSGPEQEQFVAVKPKVEGFLVWKKGSAALFVFASLKPVM